MFRHAVELAIVPDAMTAPESEHPTQDRGTPEGDGDPAPESASQDAPGSGPASAGSTASSDAGADEEAAPATEEPADPLEAAKKETARMRDQLLRTAADFDNFRKRSRRDQEDAQRRGKESVVKEILPVFDNLERAVQHADQATDVAALSEGLRMVIKQWTSTLERMGVRRVESIGKPFDPLVHEAIQHAESAEHPAGVVTAEVQPGYSVGDHLIRAALVVVSKGPGPAGDGSTQANPSASEPAPGDPPPDASD